MVLQSEIIDAGAADVDRPVHASGDFLSCATLFGKGDAQAFAGRRLLTLDGGNRPGRPGRAYCGVDCVPFPRPAHRCLLRLRAAERVGEPSDAGRSGFPFSSAVSVEERGDKGVGVELGPSPAGAPARDPHAKHHQRRQQHDQLLHGVRTGKQDASRWECSGISQRQRTRAAG